MKMKLVLSTVDKIEQEANEILKGIEEAGGIIEGVSPVAHLGNGEMALTLFYREEKKQAESYDSYEALWKDLRGEVQRRILVYKDIVTSYDKAWRTLKGAEKNETQAEKIEDLKKTSDEKKKCGLALNSILDWMEMLEENKKEAAEER